MQEIIEELVPGDFSVSETQKADTEDTPDEVHATTAQSREEVKEEIPTATVITRNSNVQLILRALDNLYHWIEEYIIYNLLMMNKAMNYIMHAILFELSEVTFIHY